MTDDELLRDLRDYFALRWARKAQEVRDNSVETTFIARIDARLASGQDVAERVREALITHYQKRTGQITAEDKGGDALVDEWRALDLKELK